MSGILRYLYRLSWKGQLLRSRGQEFLDVAVPLYLYTSVVMHFMTECHEIKTKAIATANHKNENIGILL